MPRNKSRGRLKILEFARLRSTQDEARRLAGKGAPADTVVWARAQSAGRGRLGRKWRSPAGGLYFSWLRRPNLRARDLAQYSLACGAAVARVLRGRGVDAAVKPPNDVLALCADGRRRKICGILIEARGDDEKIEWLVVGVGVNVNNPPVLRRATSLAELLKRKTSLPILLREIIAEFRDID